MSCHSSPFTFHQLVEFAFYEPALAASDGDADGEYVVAQQVGGAERRIGKRNIKHRAAFAHGHRHSDTHTPLVEAMIDLVDAQTQLAILIMGTRRESDSAKINFVALG